MSPRFDTDDEQRDTDGEPERRDKRPLRAALLALVVTALVGGSYWAGHSSKQTSSDDIAVPEIHPDTAPVKEQPKDPGGMVVPGQDSVLLNRDMKDPREKPEKPEELLPPPEAVKQRPAPPPPPPQAATNNPPPPAAAPPVVNAAPSVPPPAAAPQVATVPPPPSIAPPAPVTPKAAAPALGVPKAFAPTVPPVPGTYRLQLGALKTEELARAEWVKLQRQNSDVLGKLSLSISSVQLGGGKGIYYRIQAGPIAEESRAAQACASLKSRNVSCILVKP
jgi:hypothetical protein